MEEGEDSLLDMVGMKEFMESIEVSVESGGGVEIVVAEREVLSHTEEDISQEKKGVKSKKKKVHIDLHKEGSMATKESLEELAFNDSKGDRDSFECSRVGNTYMTISWLITLRRYSLVI